MRSQEDHYNYNDVKGQLNNYHIWFCCQYFEFVAVDTTTLSTSVFTGFVMNLWKHEGYLRHLFRAMNTSRVTPLSFLESSVLVGEFLSSVHFVESKINLITLLWHLHTVNWIRCIMEVRVSLQEMLITKVFVTVWFKVHHGMYLLRAVTK